MLSRWKEQAAESGRTKTRMRCGPRKVDRVLPITTRLVPSFGHFPCGAVRAMLMTARAWGQAGALLDASPCLGRGVQRLVNRRPRASTHPLSPCVVSFGPPPPSHEPMLILFRPLSSYLVLFVLRRSSFSRPFSSPIQCRSPICSSIASLHLLSSTLLLCAVFSSLIVSPFASGLTASSPPPRRRHAHFVEQKRLVHVARRIITRMMMQV